MRRRFVVIVLLTVFCAVGVSYYSVHASHPTDVSVSAQSSPPEKSGATSAHRKTASAIQHSLASSNAIDAHAPLPPPDTPLTKIYEELKARADADDAEAASRLFNDLGRCSSVRELSHLLPRIAPHVLEGDTKDLTPDQLQRQEVRLNSFKQEVDFVQKNQPMCEGLSDDQMTSLVPVSLQAAQLGNHDALNCYIGHELTMQPGLLDHPEWLTQYKAVAVALANSAVQQGDWTTVNMLKNAYAATYSSSLLTQATGVDPMKSYEYLKLQRLGAGNDFAARLDKRLVDEAQQLTPAQLAEADAWAQSTYSSYFGGSSSDGMTDGTRTCNFIDN